MPSCVDGSVKTHNCLVLACLSINIRTIWNTYQTIHYLLSNTTVLFCSALFYFVLPCSNLFHLILFCSTLFYFVRCCFDVYRFMFYCTVIVLLYHVIFFSVPFRSDPLCSAYR